MPGMPTTKPDYTLAQVLETLHIPLAQAAAWEKNWSQSMRTFDSAKLLCLSPGWLKQTALDLGWSTEIQEALISGLSLFDDLPLLSVLLQHCHNLMFEEPQHNVELSKWPDLPEDLHEAAGLFYAFVFLTGIPQVLKRHKKMGIPADITQATLNDYPLWLKDYKQKKGRWGLHRTQAFAWLYYHLTARLFQLGRLQFRLEKFDNAFRVYRNTAGKTAVLIEAGQIIRPDGRYDGANGIYAGKNAQTTTFSISPAAIVGQPVATNGLIQFNTVSLPASDWKEQLAQGDNVLGIHIPAGSPLTPEACLNSVLTAQKFFTEHFPQYQARAYTCISWMLDPQFALFLPPKSNIMLFQRQFCRFPIPNADDRQTLERVCGAEHIQLETMQQKTSLQRAVAAHMLAGGRWYKTGGLILTPDIHLWGKEPYPTDA